MPSLPFHNNCSDAHQPDSALRDAEFCNMLCVPRVGGGRHDDNDTGTDNENPPPSKRARAPSKRALDARTTEEEAKAAAALKRKEQDIARKRALRANETKQKKDADSQRKRDRPQEEKDVDAKRKRNRPQQEKDTEAQRKRDRPQEEKAKEAKRKRDRPQEEKDVEAERKRDRPQQEKDQEAERKRGARVKKTQATSASLASEDLYARQEKPTSDIIGEAEYDPYAALVCSYLQQGHMLNEDKSVHDAIQHHVVDESVIMNCVPEFVEKIRNPHIETCAMCGYNIFESECSNERIQTFSLSDNTVSVILEIKDELERQFYEHINDPQVNPVYTYYTSPTSQIRYALYPVAVTDESKIPSCDSCAKSLKEGKIPVYSLAFGFDYGNFKAMGLREPTMIERIFWPWAHLSVNMGCQKF